jgi:hypothetical protein
MRYLLAIFFLIIMCGCATEIVNKIPSPLIPASQQAQLKVCRKHIFLGDGGRSITLLNRRPIIKSTAGTCFSAKVSPGTYVLGVMLSGFSGFDMSELEFVLKEGQTKYFETILENIVETTEEDFQKYSNYEQAVVQ